ncbi:MULTISPECIES: class I SAM-dependent methyltransferase [unclassified Coleofasciculus]|uniref:class I SAM-dependent methyltransferase n=1 Tax=unclassified Coleofasciculus TaxID=2692782 RepID=UPI00187E6173|nr:MULTISPECIES: class I SAM-dependent methyltransferase [unclassified Coleofasciculus]MBE9125267.1 class I SAM-dependent methyltransferase [Coleofasciculus sp. LEGE 07081]MBE9147048.1 class I SAM-dependent methyltransferase [Coleofasciculus sp. LEGE 07092]
MPSSENLLQRKKNKLQRIREILCCPICGSDHIANLDTILQCRNCQEKFSISQSTYKFLSQRLIDYGKIKPTANISAHNYDSIALNFIDKYKEGLILDNGCGLRNVYYDNVVNFEIVDYPTTDVLGIGEKLPFKSDAFDAVFSLNVLEHVKNPFECAEEILRVVKPGGILYVVVPFLQPFHGYPDHYYNMTSTGLKNLFSEKVQVIKCSVPFSGLPVWCLSWFLNSYIHGLPDSVADKFKLKRVSELLNVPMESLEQDFVTQLSAEVNEELACTNSLIAKKVENHFQFRGVNSEPQQYKVQEYQTELERLQLQLLLAQGKIAAMESSKFWKLRKVWFRFKQSVGFSTDADIINDKDTL